MKNLFKVTFAVAAITFATSCSSPKADEERQYQPLQYQFSKKRGSHIAGRFLGLLSLLQLLA